MTEFQFYSKLSQLSEEKKQEVLDFIDFLIHKSDIHDISLKRKSSWKGQRSSSN
jgi:hypothetical protein